MNAATGILVFIAALGAFVGYRIRLSRIAPFTVGFLLATSFGAWVAPRAGAWISSMIRDPSVLVLGHERRVAWAYGVLFSSLLLAVIAGVVVHRMSRARQPHWQQALSFREFRVASRVVGAIDGAVIAGIAATEIALLLMAVSVSPTLTGQLQHSAFMTTFQSWFNLTGL